MILLQVDVDNLWIYENEYGVRIHSNKEYIYTHSLPKFLKLLDRYKSKATFMVIGKDLMLPACQRFVRMATAKGHEIGNHTWSHSTEFASLSYKQKKKEIVKAHKMIKEYTGKDPVGFRGPGYFVDTDVMRILMDLGYEYDASILPGIAGISMSVYAALIGRKNKNKSFGRSNDIFSSTRPYLLKSNAGMLLEELPISVLPLLRTPVHTTFAYTLGSQYRTLVLNYIKSRPSYVMYLFHAIDFTDVPPSAETDVVLPLRYTYVQRMDFAESVVRTLVFANREPLQTAQYMLTIANLH